MSTRLLLTFSEEGNNPMWMTAFFANKFNSAGDFPAIGPAKNIQLDNNIWKGDVRDGQEPQYITGTRPIAVWDGSAKVYVSLSHLSGKYPGLTLATLDTTGGLGTFRWITDYQWGECATSVVFVNQEPLYAWCYAGDNPDGNKARVTIACYATDWETTGNWNWTSNDMPRTNQGPTLLSVNGGALVYFALISKEGDSTIQLYTQTPSEIKKCIYQAETRPIQWNTFQHVTGAPTNIPQRNFYGKPAMATSSITDSSGNVDLRLHVFMVTDSTDSSPNQIYNFSVPIRSDDNNPRYTGNGDLAVENAGLIKTSNGSTPTGRGQVSAIQWDDENHSWLFVFYQDYATGLIAFLKRDLRSGNPTWEQGSFGQNGSSSGMPAMGLNRGGIAACVIPSWYGPQ